MADVHPSEAPARPGPSASSGGDDAGLPPAFAVAQSNAPPGVPRRLVVWVVAIIALLGFGGGFLEHILSAKGTAFSVSATNTTVPTATSPTTPARASSIHASLARFMDLIHLAGAPASPFSLVDQHGHHVTLAQLRGKVVVLTFFSAACNDICPVAGKELVEADASLGADAKRVALVVVNTDPLATSTAAASRTTAALGLASHANFSFLNGSLRQLDTVWSHYGVTVELSTKSHRVAATAVVYFIDTSGRVRLRATPAVNETIGGGATLPAVDEERFALGIATSARALLTKQEKP